jgi:hypothetical protein
MIRPTDDNAPDWDIPLSLTLTPAAIVHAAFSTAETVHTGWGSCVDSSLVVWELASVDEQTDNHCRLVEQEYMEESDSTITWHDWVVELKLGEVYIAAHWRVQTASSPADWDWCTAQADEAFSRVCVLFGRRVRRGLVVEDPAEARRTPKTRH